MRPAGMSDDDTDSDDDYGLFEKPVRRYYIGRQENIKKKIENNLQNAIINNSLIDVEKIIICDLNNNINDKLDTGWTPLMHACFHAQDKIVEYLLEKGADPNMHSDSVIPIMLACSNSSASDEAIDNIVSKLIDKGSVLNVGDKYGETPLMRAIASNRVAVVQKLLDMKVNIEMRDQRGWTAVFMAVYHNKPEILEMLIDYGARLTEVDKSSRTPMEIAQSQDLKDITDILNKYLKTDESDDELNRSFSLETQLRSWHEYYPGIKKGVVPNYVSEIPHLLYGMNCERLTSLIDKSGMSLRQFLLLEEKDMIKLGIELPYERQRLTHGLRNFHIRGWKLNAVAGLYAVKKDNYSVLDCLTALGAHLQQVYILEASLQYAIRAYKMVQNQLKYEPPDSPVVAKMKASAKKILTNIYSIRTEIKTLKKLLVKISNNNPTPINVMKERSYTEAALGYAKQLIVICTVGAIAYNAKHIFTSLVKK